jgi:DNA-binding LacI/PurR family transcriptional regulator
MMNAEQIENAIEQLRGLRRRRVMFVGDKSFPSLQTYLCGFDSGLGVAGVRLDRRQATLNRGWEWTSTAGVAEMEESGLTEEELCLEVIDIYLDAFRLLRDAVIEDAMLVPQQTESD